MSRIVVTGANGQLGQSLKHELSLSNFQEVKYIDVDEVDIVDREAVNEYFKKHPCDILVNCAGYTAVDRAELEPVSAFSINAEGPKYLAETARKLGFRMIHISTDYVFRGDSKRPYKEDDLHRDEECNKGPETVYGRSKLTGEDLVRLNIPDSHIIIRTSWLYSEYGHNFFKTMLHKALDGQSVKVVADQYGCPTYAGDLARAIISLLKLENWQPGVYHYCNSGVTSWYDFTLAIYELAGKDMDLVMPIATTDYPTLAKRPKYSALDTSKIREIYNVDCPDWRESLKKMGLEYINKWN